MKNIRVFCEKELKANIDLELDQSASNHLLKVLRLQIGAEVTLFNGNGNEYYSKIVSIKGKKAVLKIDSVKQVEVESPIKISLCQGLAKNDKMDIAIQKATELGVSSIQPVITERTQFSLKGDRLEKKMTHWQKIIISACEQSGRTILPKIFTPISFSGLIDSRNTGFILDPHSEESKLPANKEDLKDFYNINGEIDILVGPEGGFNDLEAQTALQNGFKPILLGPRILRTETASMAAITLLQTLYGDFG